MKTWLKLGPDLGHFESVSNEQRKYAPHFIIATKSVIFKPFKAKSRRIEMWCFNIGQNELVTWWLWHRKWRSYRIKLTYQNRALECWHVINWDSSNYFLLQIFYFHSKDLFFSNFRHCLKSKSVKNFENWRFYHLNNYYGGRRLESRLAFAAPCQSCDREIGAFVWISEYESTAFELFGRYYGTIY